MAHSSILSTQQTTLLKKLSLWLETKRFKNKKKASWPFPVDPLPPSPFHFLFTFSHHPRTPTGETLTNLTPALQNAKPSHLTIPQHTPHRVHHHKPHVVFHPTATLNPTRPSPPSKPSGLHRIPSVFAPIIDRHHTAKPFAGRHSTKPLPAIFVVADNIPNHRQPSRFPSDIPNHRQQ